MSTLSHQPDLATEQFRLGNRAFDAGDFGEASRHYAQAARAQPGYDKAWINLGLSLLHAGHPAEARRALERAVALTPGQAKPLALLAAALQRSRASDAEQIAVLEQVLALVPDAVDMRLQMASSLFGVGDYAQAHAHLARARELDPNNLVARWLAMQMPAAIVASDQAARETYFADWLRGIEWFEKLDLYRPELAAQATDTLTCATNFYLAYLGRPLVAEYRRHGAVLRKLALAAYAERGDVRPRPPGTGRRKLAVFSASLHAHSVSRVWSPALLRLDPAQFELAAFYPGEVEDASTARWRARVGNFASGERSVAAWIDALRAFSPDIVLFPDIGMNRTVQAVASLRHAPVQIAAWGHPITSGLPTIDYFLSADACEPDDADAHYSERLIRLPRLGTYLEPREPVEKPKRPSDGKQAFRFLCAQSADKLHPAHDTLFARILMTVPSAQLDVLCNMQARSVVDALAARMRREFSRHGVDFDARCRVHAQLPTADYFRFLDAADACLDSLDFSGGLTSLDALWHNLPVVTLPGQLMRGRQTYGMLKLLDIDELIATDTDSYVAIAAKLANDDAFYSRVADAIHARKMQLYADSGVVEALRAFLVNVEVPT